MHDIAFLRAFPSDLILVILTIIKVKGDSVPPISFYCFVECYFAFSLLRSNSIELYVRHLFKAESVWKVF